MSIEKEKNGKGVPDNMRIFYGFCEYKEKNWVRESDSVRKYSLINMVFIYWKNI